MGIDTDGIKRLVDQLDDLVPREGARIRLEQVGGGPDESRFIANECGFLRFGIEFLKGGLVPTERDGAGTKEVPVDLYYLLSDESDVGLQWFVRDENPLSYESEETRDLIGLAVLLGFVLLGLFAIIGLATVVVWLIKLVT